MEHGTHVSMNEDNFFLEHYSLPFEVLMLVSTVRPRFLHPWSTICAQFSISTKNVVFVVRWNIYDTTYDAWASTFFSYHDILMLQKQPHSQRNLLMHHKASMCCTTCSKALSHHILHPNGAHKFSFDVSFGLFCLLPCHWIQCEGHFFES